MDFNVFVESPGDIIPWRRPFIAVQLVSVEGTEPVVTHQHPGCFLLVGWFYYALVLLPKSILFSSMVDILSSYFGSYPHRYNLLISYFLSRRGKQDVVDNQLEIFNGVFCCGLNWNGDYYAII